MTGVLAAALLLGNCTPGPWTQFRIEVLSSPPEYVSGDDARIAVGVPAVVDVERTAITLNGQDVTGSFQPVDDARRLEGVARGLALGDNLFRVYSRGPPWVVTDLVLTNHPVEGPIFSGPQQDVFLCASEEDRAKAELGPPVDAGCAVETVVSFKYRTIEGVWADLDVNAPRPADMAQTTTLDGRTVDYVVRWERGTLNRFIYSIAVLSAAQQEASIPDLSVWNGRLIYHFQGGVGIGHYQGAPSRDHMLYHPGLGLGYAVAYSTGTATATHYNLQLGGETAIMVKDRFVSAYGDPTYTVGLGGSGGGVQQYIYAQNHKGLLDAAIAQYAYPDMITQTIHIGDCELLERWMDVEVLSGNLKWRDWQVRIELEGLNANNHVSNPYADLLPFLPTGASECVIGWRGLAPLVLNWHFGTAPGISPEQQASTRWSHYADAVNIYGLAADGFAATTWDNVGVQYGLGALVSGFLSVDEFLKLNAEVGSWKSEPDMVQEGCPYISDLCPDPEDMARLPQIPDVYPDLLDPWSWRNMALSPDQGETPAPRKSADPGAIEAAYSSGQVNRGDIEIPIIDWRNYLEDELDMHNSLQSFVTRQRLLDYDGDASNQVIWSTEGHFDQTPLALEVTDAWMRNIARYPHRGVSGNRPHAATHACFDESGALLHAGEGVWNGILDDASPGPCTARMPPFSTSRIVAGGPLTGNVFKCPLMSVDEAISSGLYGDAVFDASQRARLDAIFPRGVCDY